MPGIATRKKETYENDSEEGELLIYEEEKTWEEFQDKVEEMRLVLPK